MRSLPVLVAVVVSVLVPALIADLVTDGSPIGAAAADPVSTIWHLAPADGATATAPVVPTPTPAPPLLGDVAGPAREVSLPDLLAMAVQTAPALAQARLDRAIADEAIIRAQTWRDWNVGADAQVTTRAIGVLGQQTTVDLSGDVVKNLATGGAISLHAGASYQRTPGTLESADATNLYTETVTANLVQPLMRGRGEQLRLAAERGASQDRTAAQLAERAAAIAAVREVVLTYLDLAAAEYNLQIQRSSLDLARERLRVTEAGIRAGGVAESETIAVEQAIATREEAAMSSELAIIDQSLALRRLVGMDIGPGEIALASKIDLAVPARSWDPAALIGQALATSPDLARLAALEAGATIDVEVTENGILPQLDLGLTFGPTGTGDNPGTATKNLVTFDNFTAIASLSYQHTLGAGAAKADSRAARARREKVRVSATDIKRQIVEAMSRAVAQVQAAERRFGIAARAVKLAEKNLAVEQARLGLGRSRNVDVLIRQDELRAAQLRASQAVIDWHRAATAIAALTGELLPAYGIEVGQP